MKIMESLAAQLSSVNVDADLKYVFIIVTGTLLQLQKCMEAQNLSRKEVMEELELIDENTREEVANKNIKQRHYNAVHELFKKPNSKVFYSLDEINANILSFSWMIDYMSNHNIKGKKNVARFLAEVYRNRSQRREAMSAVARAYNTNLEDMLRSV